MIIFRLAECENVDGADQEQMDQAEVNDILNSFSYHENINLADKVVRNGIKRLGRKDGPGIRPIRVVFETEEDRDYAIRYAWMLKYDEKYRNRISLKKDLIKEDRQREKLEYERKKRETYLKSSTAPRNGNHPHPPRDRIHSEQNVEEVEGAVGGLPLGVQLASENSVENSAHPREEGNWNFP